MTIALSQLTPTLTLTPSRSVYFPDGNIILQAHTTLFRVYSGILAARSSVFNDMFAFPPPLPTMEGQVDKVVDGCTVVEVHDDPKEMEIFLRAILDSSFFEPPPTRTSLQITFSILRLSLKYDVPYLHTRALSHLRTTFPPTLAAWRTRDTTRTIPAIDNTPFVALKHLTTLGYENTAQCRWALPSICYCIASHPIEKTLEGATWEGEKVVLSEAERKMCLLGRQRVLGMQARCALRLAAPLEEEEEELFDTAGIPITATQPQTPPVAGAGGIIPITNNTIPITPIPVPVNNIINNNNIAPLAPAPLAPAPLAPTPAPQTAPKKSPNPHTTCPHPSLCTSTIYNTALQISGWNVAGFLDFFNDSFGVSSTASSSSSSPSPNPANPTAAATAESQWQGLALCDAHKRTLEERCRAGAEEMWDALPGAFLGDEMVVGSGWEGLLHGSGDSSSSESEDDE